MKKSSLRLLPLAILSASLVACASGGGGSGVTAPIFVQPTPPAPVLEPIPALPDSLSGKQTLNYRGSEHYFYNGVEITAAEYQGKSGHQIDTSTLATRFNQANLVPGTPVDTTTTNYGLPALTFTLDRAFNDDVRQAWVNGWQGQARMTPSEGMQAIKVDASNDVLTVLQFRVAPHIMSSNSYADIKISENNVYNINPVAINNLAPQGVLVGSSNLVRDYQMKTGASSDNTLPVIAGSGTPTDYGVLGATSHIEAVGVAGGYVALVMSKFGNLSGSQAGTVLKETAVSNTEGGRDLSLRRALSPTGNLR